MALNVNIELKVNAMLTGLADLGTPQAPINLAKQILLASGTGVGKADRIFADTRTLAGSANETLDLAGSLTDVLGAALTFAKVKAIIVVAGDSNAGNILVGGAASNGFVGPFADATDKIKVRKSGLFIWADAEIGETVTAGTGDLLKFENSAGSSATYTVIIIGESA